MIYLTSHTKWTGHLGLSSHVIRYTFSFRWRRLDLLNEIGTTICFAIKMQHLSRHKSP
jgi:hypothetical protein